MKVLILLTIILFSNPTKGQDFHFASIENLFEQEVGRLILPHVYNKLNKTVSIAPLPAKRAQEEVSLGRCDGEIMRIWDYGKENKATIRIQTPYYELDTRAFAKSGSGIKIRSKNDLKKYRIVVVRGVKHTEQITKNIKNVIQIGNTAQMLRFINAGRADVGLTNSLDGILHIKKLGLKTIVPLERILAKHPLYHYVHKKHESLAPEVNRIIRSMKKSGELDQIIREAEKSISGNFIK